MEFSVVIVAAGLGQRAGGAKQWRRLGGKPVVRWSVEALAAAGARQIVVVISDGAEADLAEALQGLEGWVSVAGGATRADSVQAGLKALSADDDHAVLIHDAARPFVVARHVTALLGALDEADGALPAVAVSDTLKRGDADGLVAGGQDREGLWRAQTPQAFRLGALRRAYADLPADIQPTDDASVMEHAGGRVRLVPGDTRLMKLTWPEDFAMAEALIPRETRIGQGYDVHRWGPGDTAWLCGVPVPHDQALVGHSDADAGLHALTDAILGALGEGDIGDHFPPTDPKWKGAASDQFLVHAVQMMRARGGVLVNVDVTLICERPKVKPHRLAMRQRLAELLELPLGAVSVKATTSEGLGFTGRQEGLAAQAVVSLTLPATSRAS